jgi:hypothetical protein
MNIEALKKAVALEKKIGHVFVVSANKSGIPHVAVARDMTITPEGFVAVKAWFCRGTMANVQENGSIALVVWDPAADQGYQLLGEIQNVEEVAMLDGYAPGEEDSSLPQIERRFLFHIDRVIEFKQGTHSDQEL